MGDLFVGVIFINIYRHYPKGRCFFYTKKAVKRVNEQNLRPVRNKSEASERGKKGGKASGEARREKKRFQNAVLAALDTITESGTSVLEEIIAAQLKRAMTGDTRAFEALRDTSGEKPTDKVEASVTNENKDLMREYLEQLKK